MFIGTSIEYTYNLKIKMQNNWLEIRSNTISCGKCHRVVISLKCKGGRVALIISLFNVQVQSYKKSYSS